LTKDTNRQRGINRSSSARLNFSAITTAASDGFPRVQPMAAKAVVYEVGSGRKRPSDHEEILHTALACITLVLTVANAAFPARTGTERH